MIYIIGINIAFFLGLLLFTKKNKTQADKILAIWLFIIGIHLLLFYLHLSKISFELPYLLGLEIPIPLIHGPLLFLYLASLTNQLMPNNKLIWLHFIPVLTSYLYLINFLVLPPVQKIFVYQHKGLGYEIFMKINFVAIILSGVTYIIWSSILLKRHKLNILNQFSYTEKINLKWLQYLIYGIGGIWILIFAGSKVLFCAVVLFVLFIGYFGIKQVGIFTNQISHDHILPVSKNGKKEIFSTKNGAGGDVAEDLRISNRDFTETNINKLEQTDSFAIQDETIEKKKYSKSGLTNDMAEVIHRKLTQLMSDEKTFKESELSLADLASRLNILPNYLSQIINEKEGKNFYDYINSLRIEDFQRRISLPENRKYTILSLAYDCGFNSKSSFNKNFKKATGQTPSEYLYQMNVRVA